MRALSPSFILRQLNCFPPLKCFSFQFEFHSNSNSNRFHLTPGPSAGIDESVADIPNGSIDSVLAATVSHGGDSVSIIGSVSVGGGCSRDGISFGSPIFGQPASRSARLASDVLDPPDHRILTCITSSDSLASGPHSPAFAPHSDAGWLGDMAAAQEAADMALSSVLRLTRMFGRSPRASCEMVPYKAASPALSPRASCEVVPYKAASPALSPRASREVVPYSSKITLTSGYGSDVSVVPNVDFVSTLPSDTIDQVCSGYLASYFIPFLH